MNSCVLLADVVQDPQLRYTADKLAVAEMKVQIEGLREGDPPAVLKVIGWGNLAQDIQEQYHVGDRLLLEGRLGIHTVERPEGFKDKQAELTAQRIYRVGPSPEGVKAVSASMAAATTASPKPQPAAPQPQPTHAAPDLAPGATPGNDDLNFDDIPF
jgi:single-strand DNA-binding protein